MVCIIVARVATALTMDTALFCWAFPDTNQEATLATSFLHFFCQGHDLVMPVPSRCQITYLSLDCCLPISPVTCMHKLCRADFATLRYRVRALRTKHAPHCRLPQIPRLG